MNTYVHTSDAGNGKAYLRSVESIFDGNPVKPCTLDEQPQSKRQRAMERLKQLFKEDELI